MAHRDDILATRCRASDSRVAGKIEKQVKHTSFIVQNLINITVYLAAGCISYRVEQVTDKAGWEPPISFLRVGRF